MSNSGNIIGYGIVFAAGYWLHDYVGLSPVVAGFSFVCAIFLINFSLVTDQIDRTASRLVDCQSDIAELRKDVRLLADSIADLKLRADLRDQAEHRRDMANIFDHEDR